MAGSSFIKNVPVIFINEYVNLLFVSDWLYFLYLSYAG